MDYEKKPKFKVGDTIRHKAHGDKYHYTIHCILNDAYVLDNDLVLTFNMEDSWELVESEDEKIRKAIGYAIGQSTHSDGTLINGVSSEEALAWLEKQGEQKPIEPIDLRTWKYIVDAVLTESGGMGNYLDRPWTTEVAEKLQKRFGNIEQKPVDKVEPKFKVGDWVITDMNNIVQIKAVNNGYYTIDNGMDFNMFYVDKCWNLWTIQDAKDGDVLVNWNNTAFIFKAIEDETVKFHIAYNEKWDTIKTPSTKLSHLGLSEPQFEFHPATKKQRDLLFQKMKEVGYEWDAEKNELKKIEQKQVIDYSDSFPKDNWELVHEFVEKFGRIPKDEDELNVLVEYVLKRQKPTDWSEEDERMYRGLHNLIYSTPYCDSRKELSDWLKSLKERVQPKQEWSKEDKGLLNDCIKAIDNAIFLTNPYKNKVKDWLKSLRPHKYVYLYECIKECDGFKVGNIYKSDGEWVYGDNKKYAYDERFFRPKKHWKPSDEQMNALSIAVKHGQTDDPNALKELFEQLKKLKEG